MKVYMDDARKTPEGFVRTYTAEETKILLLTRQVQFLSLDNDLGSLDPATEGYNVVNFIEELVYFDPTFPVPEMVVHSSNASRALSMRQAIKRLDVVRQQQNNNEL